MPLLSFTLNLIGLGAIVLASLIKGEKMKRILVLLFIGNALVGISYLFSDNGINGGASCLLATVQVVINYAFQSKGKPIPKWLVALYAAGFIAINLWLGGLNIATLVAVLACMTFVASILQSNGKGYRICSLANAITWGAYDIITHSYNGLITHCTLLVITVIGIVVHDIKRTHKED